MKFFLLGVLLSIPYLAFSQIITTIAGNGIIGPSTENVAATASSIQSAGSSVFDRNGNYYFSQGSPGHRISKINSAGVITTVAGTGVAGFSGDNGPATAAKLYIPEPVAVDTAGNIYIPDGNNNRIRKVDANTGIITTIVGTGSPLYNGDGIPATAANIYGPNSIAFDKNGTLYFSDALNGRIRKIDASGLIWTVAGTGVPGFAGDGGPATAASDSGFTCIKFDPLGNLFVAANKRIRKIDTFGIITTIAGNGIMYYNGENIPATNAQIHPFSIEIDRQANLYIADRYNCRIRKVDVTGKINTVAGNGIAGYNGDGIPAITAELNNYVWGLTLDSCGNLFFADGWNYRIRKIEFNPHCWPLGLENTQQEKISIYPNPANNALHIDGIQTEQEYKIHSIVGSLMQKGLLRKGENVIDVRDLPAGIYVVEVLRQAPSAAGRQDDRAVQRVMRKIIKQ